MGEFTTAQHQFVRAKLLDAFHVLRQQLMLATAYLNWLKSVNEQYRAWFSPCGKSFVCKLKLTYVNK